MPNNNMDQFARYMAAQETEHQQQRLRGQIIMVGLASLGFIFGAICFYLGRISVEDARSHQPLTVEGRVR